VSLVEEGVQRYCGSGRVIKECTPKSVAWPGLKPTPPPPPSPLRAIPIILPTFLFHSLHLTYLSPLLSSMLICESPVIIGSESL